MKTKIGQFVKNHKKELIIGGCILGAAASVIILRGKPSIPVSKDCLVTQAVKLSELSDDVAKNALEYLSDYGVTMDSTVFMVIEP